MGGRNFEFVQLTRKPPCKDCNTRTQGCHGKCEEYTGWKAEQEVLGEDLRRKRISEQNLNGVEKDRWKRYRQRLRRKER